MTFSFSSTQTRSVVNLAVLVILGGMVAVFVVHKGEETANEAQALADTPYYTARHTIINKKNNSDIDTVDTIGWKKYLNSEYGFEIHYKDVYEIRNLLEKNKFLPAFQKDFVFLGICRVKNTDDCEGGIVRMAPKDEFKQNWRYTEVFFNHDFAFETYFPDQSDFASFQLLK